MLYVYAAVHPCSAGDQLRGIDDAAIQLVAFGPIALAISYHRSSPEATALHMAAHHRVALALAESGGAVPFRFGCTFEDRDHLERNIQPRMEDLAAKLRAVAGCIEVTLHPLNSEFRTQNSGDLPGTAYLLRKKRQLDVEHQIREALAGIVKEWRRFQHGPDVRLACLVASSRLAELSQQVKGLAVMTGPWAPSSFV